MMRSLPRIAIALTFITLTLSCGSGGSPAAAPYIYAEMDSAGGSNSTSAFVYVADDSGDPITNAMVNINDTILIYNTTDQEYQGNLIVAPGDSVTLTVTTGGNTYTARGHQFDSYPVISAPTVSGTWPIACTNTVIWSAGTPTGDAFYGLGVLDAASEELIWPSYGTLQQVPITTTAYAVPGSNFQAGSDIVIVAIAKSETVANAAVGSEFIIGGFNQTPVTVADVNPILVSIDMDPKNPAIAKGTIQQFTALGRDCDGTTQDLTASVVWNSTDTSVATISNAAGSIGKTTPLTSGTTTISSTSGGVSNSTTLMVTNWTWRSTGAADALDAVAWNGSQFVAVGWFGAIFTSPDGITWTSRTSGTSGELDGIVWSGTQFVVVGDWGTILTSPDGITWTSRTSGTTTGLWAVAWSGNKFVAVGGSGVILRSDDGITWTVQESGTTQWLSGIASSGSKFVAVGGSGTLLTSDDGSTWTVSTFGDYYGRYDVLWSGNQFVTGGGSYILTSPDGITWTKRDAMVSNPLQSFAWTGTKLMAVGGYYNIYTSPDGVTWTSEPSGSREWLEAVASNGTVSVILQADGSVLTSP